MNILNYLPQLGLKPNLVNGMLFSSFASSSVSPAFSPADLTGLQLWLDAEQGLYQTTDTSTPAVADGDPVGRWSDQSGNNRHETQATAASRPTLKLAIQNGKPVVRFDGVDDFLRTGAYAVPQPWTIYLALAQRAWVSQGRVFDGVQAGTGGNKGTLIQWTSTPRLAMYAAGAGIEPTSDDLATATFGTVCCVFNGDTNSLLIVNDGTIRTGTGTGTDTANGLALGADHSGSINQAALDVGEVLQYSGAHDAATRTLISDYLRTRWGTP